ncbi:MAG TPA: sigma-70 family RNA polymerase sigma factor [Actinomycetota bacterium]
MQVAPALAEACRRGEPEAFDELVRSTHRAVYTLVLRIVGDPDDAADVTQDVYVRAWRGLKRFRGDANLATWLYRIAANTALTHVRRRGRLGTPTEPERLPEIPVADGSDRQADADVLEQALASLPPEHRAAVVLKDVYGWTCEEIAEEMGTTAGAVKVRLFRARQRLADHLSSSGVVVPMGRKKAAR